MRHTVTKTEDRRDLDDTVRRIYDEHSEAGDKMSRDHYSSLIRGGANALHRFGWIVVPRLRQGQEPHIIELA